MTSVQIMVEAFWTSKDEEMTDEDRMRAALRALAEMEPTIGMQESTQLAYLDFIEQDLRGKTGEAPMLHCARAYILAAAEEGEFLGRDVQPSSTIAKC